MKIDKKNALHWLYLSLFGLNVLIAMLLRLVPRKRGSTRIVLYGHKLNGNLLVLYQHLREMRPQIQVVFLTMDPVYDRSLRSQGYASLCVTSPVCGVWLATASAVVSDHGLHAMQPMVRLTSLKFFDVWHGIPFKGFDALDFRFQHAFDEVWVASPLHKRLYVERYGFSDSRVAITGYARTDRLVRQNEDEATLKERYGLPAQGKLVLFAPTWAQDVQGRNIYPFDQDESTFLNALSDVAGRHGATIILRAHLNSGPSAGNARAGVIPVSQGNYPDTEGILLVSEILICDWSSIAFDYLLLDRPTIFLDVPPPFAKGLSLGREYRFGPAVPNVGELLKRLDAYLRDPDEYWSEFGARHAAIRRGVYDRFADGNAAERCVERLKQHLAIGGSSR